jgi:Flp pilus assembly pilin Flp
MANHCDQPGRKQAIIGALTGQATQLRGKRRGQVRGQALVEYSLIAVLVIIAIVAILTVTGPVVGNIFSNTVYNLLGNTFVVNTPYSLVDIQNIANAIASLTPHPLPYETNTPLIPTCASNHLWAPTQVGTTGGTYVPGPC